jgi:transcriptional regulator with XRE-family HTH domain
MAGQGITEIEIASKLGVGNTTISKDIKAIKLISQQFIYDIAKSDFTYYYKQNLDLVRLILRKQFEIVDKEENITQQDIARAKILSDMLNTVSTLNGYYEAAPDKHRSPMIKISHDNSFGVRPGTRIKKIPELTPEEEEAEAREEREEDFKVEVQEALEDVESDVRFEKERERLAQIRLNHAQLLKNFKGLKEFEEYTKKRHKSDSSFV